MFDFIGKTVKIALDVATVPVAIVKDVATLGGSINDKDEPYILEKIKDIESDFEELKDTL